MYELSVAMGHESEKVTNETYAHLRKRDHTAPHRVLGVPRATKRRVSAPSGYQRLGRWTKCVTHN